MSYSPTTWETGDTITAAKLNNMEQGIANASGTLLVSVETAQDGHNLALDKTWTEIHTAILSNGVTIIKHETGEGYDSITILKLTNVDNDSEVGYMIVADDEEFISATADGYPQTNHEG